MASTAPQLWLLRHGATAWARAGRHTGRTDLPLLPEGEEEARSLAPLLTRQSFRAVLSSPLQRARRTCELAGLGERAELCDDLREWDYGAYEGITTAEIRRTVPGWTVWSHPCPNGESLDAIAARCQRVLELALERAGSDGWVALFAHGHILRSLAGTWLGLGPAGGALLALDTARVSVLGLERQQRVLLRWNSLG
jgi:broad specificity phosphatase PhoE